ncbi:hypothetical protein G7Y89_g8673 [Cudoniella acicularis]|uniref:Peroxisomal membrane protein PEX14 n=1 Tax=Cudoniella acicularis TaxID=354080 RepID=A0A8H4RIF1_9HELO|nr:hypothetical protein G7Y89_g8673 [Cudoniella acicularis]
MTIREDLVSSAVTFLQDPSVSGSPIENRIAFLQSKNLTQEEVDTALARASGESAPAPGPSNYIPQQQVTRQPQPGYGGYQQYPWQQPPPPEVPKRDWRDWFIMATVMGGVGYGLYFVAKRYVYPMIAPPTAPQLEQDKQAIDDQFEKAFSLLEQLSKDTDALKSSEQARTERLDAALTEVESVISELKTASRRREEESRRISDEVRGLKDLIPKAMEGQKETTDTRLRELNTELKSLKTLMGQRLNPPASPSTSTYGRPGVGTSTPAITPNTNNYNGTAATENSNAKPVSVSSGNGTEAVAALQNRSASPFGSGFGTSAPAGKAAIPAWQMAAGNKSSSTMPARLKKHGSLAVQPSASFAEPFSSPPTLSRAVLPKVPLMGKTALQHTFGLSEQSKFWDLRTALTVNILRSFIVDSPAQPVSKVQHMSIKDPGIKGKIWVAKVTMPTPEEDDVRQALFKAIEGLKEPEEAEGGFTLPELLPVEAEWTGNRAGAAKHSAELKIPEQQKYTEMMREVYSPTTILYFHGGAYYLMDPASHRETCKKLAKLTKGRCFSVRYRLAPQYPFPAAVLDGLVSYFTLLYPPPGSFHEAVKPEHIVFAGDSAGGNLALALTQTILEFHRQGLKVHWNGEERDAPLPAGVAACSPWLDITYSSPSSAWSSPPDGIWPANPPRKNLYADDGFFCHPLVSPLAVKSWEGCCPLYIETGQELLTDEDRHLATKAALQGVPVVFEEYEAMPHCFAMVLESLPGSVLFFSKWAGFITDVVEKKGSVATKGTRYAAKTLKTTELDVKTLSGFTNDEVADRMKERMQKMTTSQPDLLSKL